MLRELWLDDKHHSIPIFLTWQGLARGKFCRSGEGSSGAPGGPAKERCQQEAHTGSEWGSCRLAVSEARQTEPDQVQRACMSCRAKPEQAVGTLGLCPWPGLWSQPPGSRLAGSSHPCLPGTFALLCLQPEGFYYQRSTTLMDQRKGLSGH